MYQQQPTATELLSMWNAGLVTQEETEVLLEALQVHGGFNSEGYTGFDYNNQEWVTA